MANDFDMNWDDEDIFGSDIDFDMSFDMDPFKGKGFIRSFATGFLSGVGEETFGSSAARMRTIRTILPGSFTTGLDKVSFIGDRIDELAKEFKEENYETAKSLQSIASSLSKKYGASLPNSVRGGIESFSEKDFSDWENSSVSSNKFNPESTTVTEGDVGEALDRALTTQASMFGSLGETLNQMTAAATASLQSAIGAGNRQLVNIESSVRDLMSYHRNVQAKMDQAKINLMARSYVQDAKFYKFMEAGIHEMVKESKKISAYSAMSEYQKTSNFTASKAYLRDKVFQTIGKRAGGLTQHFSDRFSESDRKGAYGAIRGFTGDLAAGLELGEGKMSRGLIGDALGRMVAGMAVEEIPIFFSKGPGKKIIDQLIRKYPEQGAWIKNQVKEITDIGNIFSYTATTGTGILNHLAENFQAVDENKFDSYEDYLASLPPNKKPIPKAVWVVTNGASNKAKSTFNKMMLDMTRSRGTQYTIKRKDVKELNQPGIWKEINNITLNEVLPGLISRTNQILMNISTGRNDSELVTYNHMRGQFQTESQKKISVQADLMPNADFKRYATAALELVDSVDPRKLLSGSTRKAFASVIAKDIDADKGFNPYYYLGEIPGLNKSQSDEVHDVLKMFFDISTSDVDRFNKSDSLQRGIQMTKMGTERSRERLNKVGVAAQDMRANFPNVAERIDLLRATGNEQLLRDLGVIYTEGGIDRVNVQVFHDRIGMYMDDPNNPLLKGQLPGESKSSPPTLKTLGANAAKGNQGDYGTGTFSLMNNNLEKINETLAQILNKDIKERDPQDKPLASFDTQTGVITDIRDTNKGILDNTTEMSGLMNKLYEVIKSGGILTGKVVPQKEREQAEKEKQSFFGGLGLVGEKIKGVKNFLTSSPIATSVLIGGVLASGISNPLNATLAMGAAIGIGMEIKRRRGNTTPSGNEPNEDQDILDEKGEPILKASKKNAGEYVDSVTGKVINSWNDIKGPVMDKVTKAVIGVRDLSNKIFGPDGRAVMLKGLQRARDAATNAYNLANPIGRIRNMIQIGKDYIFQQDVYVSGEKSPRLSGPKFKSGAYFVKGKNGEFKVIEGWNEITGPVYDEFGNQLISEDDIKAGLVTSSGQKVREAGNIMSTLVGSVAGMGKTAFDSVMGKVGYSRGAPGTTTAAGSASGSGGGVERRLDRIYSLLAEWSGITPNLDPLDVATSGAGASRAPKGFGAKRSFFRSKEDPTSPNDTHGLRLNSLEYKEEKEQEEEQKKVNEAIIKIADNVEGLTGEGKDKNKSEKKGLLGSLAGFAMDFIKNPFKAIGQAFIGSMLASGQRLAKIGSLMFSAVLGIGSPIFELLKWGFKGVMRAVATSKIVGGIGDRLGGGLRRGKGRIGKAGRAAKGKLGNFRKSKAFKPTMAGLATAGLAYAGGDYIDDALDIEDWDRGDDLEVGERDPFTGRIKTRSDQVEGFVRDWTGIGWVADKLGQGLVGGTENAKALDDMGRYSASDGKVFYSRKEYEAHEAKLMGIEMPSGEAPKYYTDPDADAEVSLQKRARFIMYGVPKQNTMFATRVAALENRLSDYVEFKDGRCSLSRSSPWREAFVDFVNGNDDPEALVEGTNVWFNKRFLPIFLIFSAAVRLNHFADLSAFDKADKGDIMKAIRQAREGIVSLREDPYSVHHTVDTSSETLDKEWTIYLLKDIESKLSKKYSATYESGLAPIKDQAQTLRDAHERVATGSPNSGLQGGYADAFGNAQSLAYEKEQMAKFQINEQVSTIDISDLTGAKDGYLDPFTAFRLNLYGNNLNMSWRCEAVLKLERYMEQYIAVFSNGDVRFTSTTAKMYELFRNSFRIEDGKEKYVNNWFIWFRDRFLPVVMTYVSQVQAYKKMNPVKAWTKLSDNEKYDIARVLDDTRTTIDKEVVSVWDNTVSPFPQSRINPRNDKANDLLKILEGKSAAAKIREISLAAAKLASGKDTPDVDAQKEKASNYIRSKMGGVSNADRGYGSGNKVTRLPSSTAADGKSTGYGTGSLYPNATMDGGAGPGSAGSFTGSVTGTFNPEYLKNPGNDNGIKMSLEDGEQLMLRKLVEAGFTDNKVLALALAMARYETGGYAATAEDTRWGPDALLRYFKNVKTKEQANQIAQLSPEERAIAVYGLNPKAKELGNTQPEDGWNYRGRGFFQLTGRGNYTRFQQQSGYPVLEHPELLSENPDIMAESAVNYLKNNKAMKSIASTGDYETASRGLNGGLPLPAGDKRRAFYDEYLSKLTGGSLALKAGAVKKDDEKKDPLGVDTVPSGADKNVPKDKTAGSENNSIMGGAIPNLGNTPPKTNAASGPATAAATKPDNSKSTPAQAPKAQAPNGNAVGAPVAKAPSSDIGTVNNAAQIAAKAAADQANKQPLEVKLPDTMTTSDPVVAKLLIQLIQAVKEGGNGDGGGIVSMK